MHPVRHARSGPLVTIAASAILVGAVVAPPAVALAAAPTLPVGEPAQPQELAVQGVAPLTTDRTIAHWHGQFTDPATGTTYGYNMVGADPALERDVTIPVDLIPVKAVFTAQGNFTLDGSSVIERVIASPLFQAADFSSTPAITSAVDGANHVQILPGGELSAGNTSAQYLDATMRSQFDKIGTSYHVRLGRPTVLSPWTIDCSKASGAAFQNRRGIAYGICSNYSFNPPWGQWKPDPTHLIIFVTNNILIGSGRFCCAIGYHLAGRTEGRGAGSISGQGSQAVQTWSVSSYIAPGTFNPAISPYESTIDTFNHEIAEWADDPFANNIIGNWYSPLPPQDGCGNYLETGDAVDRVEYGLPGNIYDGGPYADGYWHLQDTNFLPWFSRQAPNTTSQVTQTPSASRGRYSFMGDLNPYPAFHQPAATC